MTIYKKGFTLAEVLITLAIIGVIAAFSIPTLLQSTQNEENKVAYKKAFTIASQAINKALMEDTLKSQSSQFDLICTNNFNTFKSYFRVIKDCNGNNNDQCWNPTGEKLNSGYPSIYEPAFIDASGMAWSMYYKAENIFVVDTNGHKPPNWYGRDRWVFTYVDVRNNRITSGTPDKVGIGVGGGNTPDYLTYNAGWCQHPPCYFQSWISK